MILVTMCAPVGGVIGLSRERTCLAVTQTFGTSVDTKNSCRAAGDSLGAISSVKKGQYRSHRDLRTDQQTLGKDKVRIHFETYGDNLR